MTTEKQNSIIQNILPEDGSTLRTSNSLSQTIVYPNQNMFEDINRVYNDRHEDYNNLKLNYKRSSFENIIEKNNTTKLNSAGCSPSSFPNSSKSVNTNSPVDQKPNHFENSSMPLHMRTNFNSAIPNTTLISNGGHLISEGILNQNRLVAHPSQTHVDLAAYQHQQLNQALRSHNYQHAQDQLHLMENFPSIDEVVPNVGVAPMLNPDLAQSLHFPSNYTHHDLNNHTFFSHRVDSLIPYDGHHYNTNSSSEYERSLHEGFTEDNGNSPNGKYSLSNASEIDYDKSSTNIITDDELKVLSVRELNRRLRGNK